MMKKHYSSVRGVFGAIACTSVALVSAPFLHAQDIEDDSQVFELSPFAVEGADDVGYRASSTLAGTRISTNLRDVASSISIVTEQFLEDTGSTTIADVLLYTANTEASGIRGNFSGAQDTGSGNPILERDRDDQQGGFTRVRGLVRADLTRDYFLTDVPMHSFNTTRVTVQRGANAALFGLGSPGGVVNQTTVQADFSRDRGRVRFETDEYGTARASFRANMILREDLAIFVAGVRDQTKYQQRQAFSNDNRAYVATTYQPRNDIVIRGSVEFGDRRSSRPDIMPPNDGITPWIEMGSPTFDSPVEAAQFFRGSGDIIAGQANSQFFGPHTSSGGTAFYFDPTQPEPTQGGTMFVRGGRGVENHFGFDELMMIYPRIGVDIIRRTGFRPDGSAVQPGSGGFFSGGNQGYQITDRSVFDYRKNIFSGGASQQWSDWRMINLSAEKTWLDDTFGVEVAYFKQDFNEAANNSLQGSVERAIIVDPNRYLIAQDGSGDWVPNPNFGGLAMMGLSGGNVRVKDMDEVRVTGFVDFEFSDLIGENILSRALGRVRVSGVGQERKRYMETYFARDKLNIVPLENAVAGGDRLSNVDYRYYEYFALQSNINNYLSLTDPSQLAGANIQPVPFGSQRQDTAATTFTLWDEVSESFVEHSNRGNSLYSPGGMTPAAFFARKSTQTTKSEAVVGQQYLWDDLIVLTGSWRRDRVYGSPNVDAQSIGRDARDVSDSAFLRGPQGESKSTDQQNRTWGWVAYAPPIITDRLPWGTNISIHKSKADNFGGGLGRRDSLNRQIAPVTGATEEMGFTVSTLDDKLIVKFNWYETGILNQSFQNTAISAPQGILENLARQLDNPQNQAQGFTAADAQAMVPASLAGVVELQGVQFDWDNPQNTTSVPNPSRTGTQDFVSEGLEIEVNYNPVPNWNIIFSFADQKTTTDNTYPVIGPLFENIIRPLWIDSNFAANYFIDDNATETLRERTIRQMEIPISVAQAQDGLVTSEQRRYRFSLSSSYRFLQDSPIPAFLGTFTVGGSLRWQDKVGAGFELMERADGSLGQDPNAVLYGPSQTFLDVFARSEYDLRNGHSLAVQVNIRDLTDNSGLVPLFINPDGSTIWRMQEGRVITGSLTYSW